MPYNPAMEVYTYPDITGSGSLQSAAVVLGITSQPCKWYQVTIVSNASAQTMRLGNANISSTQGIPLGGSAGATSQFFPQISEDLRNYDIKDLFLLIPNGDTVSVAYGV